MGTRENILYIEALREGGLFLLFCKINCIFVSVEGDFVCCYPGFIWVPQ